MTTLNGTQARRYATYGRAGGIAILVCAGALWAVPLPGMKQLPAKPVPLAPPPVADAAPAGSGAKVDAEIVDATATRLDMAVVHAEKPKTTDVAKAPEELPAATAAPEWTYLGPIHEADRTLAIIAIDGHQKILAEGRTFGDTKLVSVAKDGIDVEVKGTPKHIAKGERDPSKSVAWVRNLQNNAPAVRTAGIPGQPQPNAGNLTPEVQARLAQRGMTPDQVQNWRNGGGPGGGNRGNGGNNGGGPNGNGRNRGNPNGVDLRGDMLQPLAVPINVKQAVPADSLRRSAN